MSSSARAPRTRPMSSAPLIRRPSTGRRGAPAPRDARTAGELWSFPAIEPAEMRSLARPTFHDDADAASDSGEDFRSPRRPDPALDPELEGRSTAASGAQLAEARSPPRAPADSDLSTNLRVVRVGPVDDTAAQRSRRMSVLGQRPHPPRGSPRRPSSGAASLQAVVSPRHPGLGRTLQPWSPERAARRPPPSRPPPAPREHRPVAELRPEDPPAVLDGDGDAPIGSASRRSSAARVDGHGHAGAPSGGTVSPTLRHGRVAFVEGATGYLLDTCDRVVIGFNPAVASQRRVRLQPGAFVSYRRAVETTKGGATVRATAVGPAARSNSELEAELGRAASGGDSGAFSRDVTSRSSGRTDSIFSNSRNRRPSAASSLFGDESTPAGPTSPSGPQSDSGQSPSGGGATRGPIALVASSDPADEFADIPAEGWEFYRLLQRQRGDDRFMTASPDTLVRLVDASCRYDADVAAEHTRVRQLVQQASVEHCAATLDEAVPGDGPLMRPRARAWARVQPPEVVMEAARRAIAVAMQPERLSEHLLLDDRPPRFSEDDVEDWMRDADADRLSHQATKPATAAAAYAQWYLKPEQRFDAYRAELAKRSALKTEADAQRRPQTSGSRKKARPATGSRGLSNPPSPQALALKAPPGETAPVTPQVGLISPVAGASEDDVLAQSLDPKLLSLTNNTYANTAVKGTLMKEQLRRELDVARTAGERGAAVDLRQLTAHIERVQQGNRAAVLAMVRTGAAAAAAGTRKERASGAGSPAGSPFNATLSPPSPGIKRLNTFTFPADRSPAASPRDAPLQPQQAAEAAPSSPARDSRAPGTGSSVVPRSSARNKLPKEPYHGRWWAMSQGAPLTMRNAPSSEKAEAEIASFVAAQHKIEQRAAAATALRREPKQRRNSNGAPPGVAQEGASRTPEAEM